MTKKIRVYLNLDEQNEEDIRTYNMLSIMFDSPQKRNRFVTECVKKELLGIDEKTIDDNDPPKEPIQETKRKETRKTQHIENKKSPKPEIKIAHNGFRRTILDAKDKLLTSPR